MNIIKKGFALLLLFGLFPSIFGSTMKTGTQAKEFDLLIAGGRVVDGTGNPWFYGKHNGTKSGQILRGKGVGLKLSQTALFNQPITPIFDLFINSTKNSLTRGED